jgi:protocatechuate 4,5-dioxygenase alpha subunit
MDRQALFGPPADIEGIVRFDGERAQHGYALTKFLVSMRDPAMRAKFAADEEGTMLAAGLSCEERALVARRDYQGMIEHGASIYALGKGSGALGTTLLDMGAQARGMSTRDFVQMKERARGAG